VFFCGDAYAPSHWPSQVVHYANTYGQDKFMFGTDWPVIEPERAVRDIQAHNYRPDPYRKMMRDNAIKAFKLPSGGLQTRPADWCTLMPGGALESRLNPV
jgi:predicted TIM-barrel fold metal-dependent hydrolase